MEIFLVFTYAKCPHNDLGSVDKKSSLLSWYDFSLGTTVFSL